MAADPDDLQQAAALSDALRRSGWHDRASLQDALYGWAASGLPVGEIRDWLAASIADPEAALGFRELGIGPHAVRVAGIGEQVSIGQLPVDDAARTILGAHATGDLDQLRAARRSQRLAGTEQATQRNDGREWWESRIQRLGGFLHDQPAPQELVDWLRDQPDYFLCSYRDAAVHWAGVLTIAVAQQELERLGSLPMPSKPAGSEPLVSLIFGALSIRELTRRLGERVEAAITTPPAYLTATLGPYPDIGATQLIWTRAALAVEEFRLECEITDPQHALGPPDALLPFSERDRFQQLNRALPRIPMQLERLHRSAQRRGDAALQARRHDTALDGEGWEVAANDHRQQAESLFDPGALRPDQELKQAINRWLWQQPAVQRTTGEQAIENADFSDQGLAAWWDLLPGRERAWLAGLSDKELAAHWDQAVQRHLRSQPVFDPTQADQLAAATTILSEIDRRGTARFWAAVADPPHCLIKALGPRPADPEAAATWDLTVQIVEEYRLLTGTTDQTRALGSTPAPDVSWQQCWRRELAQDVADVYLDRMLDQHQVIGSPQQREQLAALTTSTADLWLDIRADAQMEMNSEGLPTGELRRHVATAVPVLSDRPDNLASQLREAQLHHARLLDYQQEERAALAAANAKYARSPLMGRGALAARATARLALHQHEQALAGLERRLADTAGELARLEQAQAAYLDWRREHLVQIVQGQAAAKALQAREIELLDELAAYPPTYLLAEVGQPPTNPDGRAAWQRGALAIERYRAAHHICDADEAFSAEWERRGWERRGWAQPSHVRQDQQRTRQLLDDVRRTITDSLARELDGLSVPEPNDGLGDYRR